MLNDWPVKSPALQLSGLLDSPSPGSLNPLHVDVPETRRVRDGDEGVCGQLIELLPLLPTH